MKKSRVICLAVITAFFFYSLYIYQSSLTPYVTFAQARSTKNVVQVKGTLTTQKITQTDNGRAIAFVLRDDAGEEVTVNYSGDKPVGMGQATSVVAIGKYSNEQFIADKILVKCPSKYQGSVNQ